VVGVMSLAMKGLSNKKIRKAILLAAGRGERMRPLTDQIPKPLVKVAGKALIEHHLFSLVEAGVEEVVINSAHLGEQIIAALGDGSRYGLSIHYSSEAGGALETAGGILQALPLLCSDCDDFIVVNTDVWTDYHLKALLHKELGDNLAHLVMIDTPDFKSHGDFYLPHSSTSHGQVALQAPGELLTFSGLSVLSKHLFAGLEPGRLPLLPLLQKAIEAGRVTGEYYAGDWEDVGTIERFELLNSRLG
jgi:MurNAc alpha-1-phosphate uridylyltransferase